MTWLLVFLAGSIFGSLFTAMWIALGVAARIGDEQLDGQQRWRDDVRRLLGEPRCQ